MSALTPTPRATMHRLPSAWRAGVVPGTFVSLTLPGAPTAVITVNAAESDNADYLLTRYEAAAPGPLGRPVVQALPELLADGVSIVSFVVGQDAGLSARIDLVRRAWNLDIAVSARGVAIEHTDQLYSDMLDLLWEVRPEGAQ